MNVKPMTLEEIILTLDMRADHHIANYKRVKLSRKPEDGDPVYYDGFSDGYDTAVADLKDMLDEHKK